MGVDGHDHLVQGVGVTGGCVPLPIAGIKSLWA